MNLHVLDCLDMPIQPTFIDFQTNSSSSSSQHSGELHSDTCASSFGA